MKKHSKLCAIFLTALLSISAVSFSVSAVGEDVDPGGDSSVIVDPVEPDPEPDPVPDPDPVDPGSSDTPSYVDPGSSDTPSYVDPGYSSDTSSYDNNNDYNYDNNNNYNYNDNNYSSSENYYSEPSYVGGGQSYVAPSNTAPSAALIKSDDNIDEKTLSSSDWSDISKNLKNANTSNSDGDDFNFIKNNDSKGDNGHWMFYVSLVLLALGIAGIAYFVISTVLNRKRVAVGRGHAPSKNKSAQSAAKAQRYSSNDDYADDYSSSKKKPERRSKYDTAEITLPKNNSKGGRRYK